MKLNCPNCKNHFQLLQSRSETEVTCPSCKSKISIVDLLSVDPSLSRTRSLKADAQCLELGDFVAHFKVVGVLGSGGFGNVYKAYDTRLDRHVALKIPRMKELSRWQAEVFIREAQAAAQIQDANIVAVHEIGRDDNGQVYIVSELIQGLTLKEWASAETPTPQASAKMIAKIARAIHKAHSQKIVHRDLKPSNVIVDPENEPHVADFGLAKRDQAGQKPIARDGQVIGTPSYMSPEQAKGKSHEADGRTDIYSLGVMLYELLTGIRPFRGESDHISSEIIQGDFSKPRAVDSSIHPDVESICLKAMARDAKDRYRSGNELADDLEAFVAGEPILPLSGVQKFSRFVKRYATVISASILTLTAIGVAIWFATRPAKTLPYEEPAPGRMFVEFNVSEPDCSVAIVRVDLEEGRIDYDSIHSPDPVSGKSETFTDSLIPGWYIVEAVSPDGDIQEVWRKVPESMDEIRAKYACEEWEPIDERKIRWKPIEIVKLDLEKQKLLSITGGVFETGADDFNQVFAEPGKQPVPLRPKSQLRMYSYLAGQFEVSAGEFEAVMDRPPNGMALRFKNQPTPKALAATNVTFYEALEYCERTGTRLPVFEEYLFLVTNGGKTKFPTGNQWQFQDWIIGDAGKPEKDKNEFDVFNLYSSVLEWTQDVEVPLHPKQTLTNNNEPSTTPDFGNSEIGIALNDTRLVVGGPNLALLGPIASYPISLESPRKPNAMPVSFPASNGLGFRCYRSIEPRLNKNQPLIQYLMTKGNQDK